MQKFIDAEDFLKNRLKCKKALQEDGTIYIPLTDVIRSIREAPEIKVSEVREGHWVDCRNGFYCSRCLTVNYDPCGVRKKQPFCSHCGSENLRL